MIKAHFQVNADGKFVMIELTGHADSGDYGHDIVCAAVSAVVATCVNALSSVAHVKPHEESDDEQGGFIRVTEIGSDHDSQIICQTLLDGLLSIQQQYGQYLEVKMFN
ncbi:MAG: ribosomal-processing cysteine protease Prp [[Lactobacillus] timonensis]|jgi:uncharacterized protein YsxB (DUF464 family)|uniref:ribosomal-processing cysteine protease Prp n=1 Tax=[Lactobacillus] timonensis TaxID=1970790 RepID=UPI000C85EEC2|nr:ribosomal-processing cysteine protease Prp [[Lactobacillus] timonensis]MCI1287687.1 ribosomal-processing cysteine protease Prp [[Lactobacillus] timonensis]MCI1957362.1 ribosomal-processing cysteine protease Prp [[Lactobacillus] timonensis]MCI1970460.1 ribosomal-processing cysteine protease Prp [[Lactobacillus] timonensis]